MERVILSARSTLSLECYLFEADDIGRSIAMLLIDKARAGVKVQVIYDSEGSSDTPGSFWDSLRAAGIQVLEYNPLDPLKVRVAYEPNDRDHRKLLIADGKRAVLGGINISDIYLYGGADSGSMDRWWLGWRDTDVAIEGPVVAELQRFFLDVWAAQKGDPLPPSDFFPPLVPAGPSYVRAVAGTPQQGDPEIYVALLSAIRNAREHVWLTTAFFDPTEEARHVLADAARRGIDVQLIVPGQSDSEVTLAAGRSRYDELLRAGVKIFEMRGVFLHAKTATIDGVWSIVGSSNLDTRSVIWNNEISSIVLGRDFAAQMEAAFGKDRARGTAIDIKSWDNRPLGERLEQWSARAFESLL
jgi:cardiolipin synthase